MSNPLRPLVLLLVAVLSLVACSTPTSPTSQQTTTESSFQPVTISHVHGETEITQRPTRVVTIGWYSQDVVAALGIVPVGVEDFTWGSVEKYLPWFKDRVAELGGELPELLRLNDKWEHDYEQILALEPDVILALHSGIDETAYQRLSEIAPTVAYSGVAWTSERERLTLDIGRVLGMEQEAQRLLDEADAAIAEAAGRHPEFKGVVFTYGSNLAEGETQFAFYVRADPRVRLLEELGFVTSPDIVKASEGASEFVTYVSLEELSQVESQFHVGWGDVAADVTRTLEHPLVARWAPVAAGHTHFFVEDHTLAWASTAPSVLSIPATVGAMADDLAKGLPQQ
ncbi:ABC transporter substrate-binding protein [Arachnia propionica]|uniref:Iron-siderophore ABC transporter substrate-binding protein n=1 Tax=Arachnia propionica TaxID=1750 RepID=A0A3P1WXR5_9ACTN|nr:ABC transporter substrate-binding protein [Arachnia propionica]RRD50965.1 iron-siderophore ABC transporter substrate-binding protein [Arachnia propionica]